MLDNESIDQLQKYDLNKLIELLQNSYSSNNFNKTYTGIVEDNKDPDKLGRCKVRVYGVFDDNISTDLLPWANGEFVLSGSKINSFIVPEVDSLVKIYFMEDDINHPIYTNKTHLDTNNLPTNIDKNYPNNIILFEMDDGTSLEYNKEKKELLINYIDHNEKNKIVINEEGISIIDNNENKIVIDKKGIIIKDTNGNEIVTKSSGITVNAVSKTIVDSSFIELGKSAVESVIKGDTFKSIFDAHIHTGNLGIPTSPPVIPSLPVAYSTKNTTL